jgi:hypothetical protein
VTETLDETAQKIADQGRDALYTRLRPAFEEAAAAHADVLELSPEQLDEMVQRAVERADGLQWRRALASVATDELGISLGEALAHPAVARAQELAGAPSYEASLARLGPLPGRDEATGHDPAAEGTQPVESSVDGQDVEDAEAEADARDGDRAAGPAEAEPDQFAGDAIDASDGGEPEAEARTAFDVVADREDEDEEFGSEPAAQTIRYELDEPGAEGDTSALRVAVIHLGGIANLSRAERDIELQMSDDGLDIVRGGDQILGRLEWDQVRALEVPEPKHRRRMRRGMATHLVVRTARGDASFEVPEVSPPELLAHLAPFVAKHVRGM